MVRIHQRPPSLMRFPRERILIARHRDGLVPEVRELLQESQNAGRTGWLSIQTDDFQDLIFLERGELRGAGSIVHDERQREEIDVVFVRIAGLQYGIVSFYEAKPTLMKIVLSTFQRSAKLREPMGATAIKRLVRYCLEEKFTGFFEITIDDGLNYLFFFEGMATEIYPCDRPGQVADLSRLKEFLDGITAATSQMIVAVYEFQVRRPASEPIAVASRD